MALIDNFELPAKCEGCTVLTDLSEGRPFRFKEHHREDIQAIFEACPGFKTGVRGILRSLKMDFEDVLDASYTEFGSGALVQEPITHSPLGCGTHASEFIALDDGLQDIKNRM